MRLSDLADHYGEKLALLATMPGDRSVEAEIHERFSHLRLGKTEQFQPAADLMAFIGKPLLVDISPDAVEAHAVVRRPVRLELSEADHERLENVAEVKGVNKASYARMAVLDRIRADEGGK